MRWLLPGIIAIPFLLSWIMVGANRIKAFDVPFGLAILAVASTFVLGIVLCLASAWLARWEAALRQSNRSLTESEHIARGIIDTALDAFVQVDESGRVTDWNPQAEAVFGWSRTEALGRPLVDLIVPPSLRESYNAERVRFLQTGESDILGKRFELDALRKDGRTIKVELTATALERGSGYVFNGFIRDLTEKLAIEARLHQSEKMDAIGNLTGGIAHDFNNLLAVIVGNLDELQLLAKDNPKVAELTDMALSAALRGADLTQRLLVFARRQPLTPRPIELNALLGELAKMLSRTLGEAVQIELDLAADTWSIIADPAQLEAAILNLTANARDAMPDGGKITIATSNCSSDKAAAKQISDLAPGDYAVVEVRDNGTGMSPEVCSRIFEPFYTTKERGKGTGLGLAMVFGFVKQSNGHIGVYSEPDVGTVFRLYFPCATAEAKEVVPEIAAPPRLGRGETVLVVEDNADLRKLAVRQVKSLGYHVLEAENAQIALALFERETVDLLFTDVVMPGGCDGVELARQILARAPETRVVLTSGFASGGTHERFGALERSAQLLRKPYRKEQLSEALRSALDSQPRG